MRISVLAASVLAVGVLVSTTAAQTRKADRTIVGYITDSMCGLDHSAMKMGDDKECTIKCVEGGATDAQPSP